MVRTDRSGEQAVETLDDWTRPYGFRRSTAAAGGGRYFLNGMITARKIESGWRDTTIVHTKGIAGDAEGPRQLAERVGITLPGDAGWGPLCGPRSLSHSAVGRFH
jgi:hypothetical protein